MEESILRLFLVPMYRVYLAGFRRALTEQMLRLILEQFGGLRQLSVRDESVVAAYESREAAATAVRILDQRRLADASVLSASFYYHPMKRLVVERDLPVPAILDRLSAFGPIYNTIETARQLLVDFYDKSDVTRIFAADIIIDDTRLRVSRPKAARPAPVMVDDSHTLFLYNLPADMTEDEIHGIFSRYGEIVSCGVSQSGGFGGGMRGGKRGYVNYSASRAVQKALKRRSGKTVRGLKIVLRPKTETRRPPSSTQPQ